MLKISKIIKNIAFIIAVVAISLSLTYIVSAWSEPLALPPAGNADAPLNVSAAIQTKQGQLVLNANSLLTPGLVVNKDAYFLNGNVGIGTTAPAAGRILDVNGPVIFSGGTDVNGISILNNDILVGGAADASFGFRLSKQAGKLNRIGFGSQYSDSGLFPNEPWTLAIDLENYRVGVGKFSAGKLKPSTMFEVYNGTSTVLAATEGGNVGVGTLNPQGALDVSSTTGAFIVPRMTTAQRDALVPVNGMIIYNTDVGPSEGFNFYEKGAWVLK